MKLSSLQKGLVGHWTMSQDSIKGSLLADKTPYENDGTIYGATFTTDRKGKANSAMSFDGVDDYIDIDFPNELIGFTTQDFTISFWMNAKTFSGQSTYKRIIDITETISPANNFQFSGTSFNNQLQFYGHKDGIIYRKAMNPETTPLNEWIYVVGLWKSNINDISLYVNTIEQTNSGYGTPTAVSSNVFNIGRRGDGNTDTYFNGSIDDVRIYNRALSQEEITLLYNSYNPSLHIDSLQKGLVAHWTMSEDSLQSATVLADKTPYENKGTIYGATFTTDRMGQANKAMSFDGVDDYIDCGTPIIPAGDFSISAWCYNNGAISEYNSICGQYTAGQAGRMWFGFQKSAFGYRIGEETETVSVEHNKHLHCVITREGTTVKVYLNGNLVITRTAVDSIYQGANTIIGSYDSTAGSFNGSIDDVRIYNRALSQEEITKLYESYNPCLKLYGNE